MKIKNNIKAAQTLLNRKEAVTIKPPLTNLH